MSRLVILAAGFVAVMAAFLALIWTMQRRLMYFPSADVPAPGEIGLTDVEPVTFETIDGLGLSGWFFADRRTIAARDRSGLSTATPAIERTGVPWRPRFNGTDCRCCSSTIEAMAEIPELRRRTGSLQTAGPRASTWPVAPTLISRGSCTSASRSERRWLSALPSNTRRRRWSCDRRSHRWPTWDGITIRFYRCVFFFATGSRRSIRFQRIQVPLLVIAGGHDRIVPIENSRRLYDAAVAPKTLLVLPDADHNDYELLAGDEMIQAIVEVAQPLT